VGAVTYYDLAAEAFESARASALGGTGHACEFETSLMLHLQPDAVGDYSEVQRPINPRTASDMRDLLHPGTTAIGYTFDERFPEGVMGDPTVSSTTTGRAIYQQALERLTAFIDEFRHLPPEGVRANQDGSAADRASD
jgi:creatinine amidohydrolase